MFRLLLCFKRKEALTPEINKVISPMFKTEKYIDIIALKA